MSGNQTSCLVYYYATQYDVLVLEKENNNMRTTERDLLARVAVLEAEVLAKTKEIDDFSIHARNRDSTTDSKLTK